MFTALSKARHLVDEESDELLWELCHWLVDLNVELDAMKTWLTRFRNRRGGGRGGNMKWGRRHERESE